MINIFQEQGGDWVVWTDTEVQREDGRCIGVGKTKILAMVDAMKEIKEDLAALTNELANELEIKK